MIFFALILFLRSAICHTTDSETQIGNHVVILVGVVGTAGQMDGTNFSLFLNFSSPFFSLLLK